MTHRDKTVAYIDRSIGDEILGIEAVDVLPRQGQPLKVGGDNWTVFDVREVVDEIFDALVRVDRRF